MPGPIVHINGMCSYLSKEGAPPIRTHYYTGETSGFLGVPFFGSFRGLGNSVFLVIIMVALHVIMDACMDALVVDAVVAGIITGAEACSR